MLSPAAHPFMEVMAQRARALTQRHFGRTISMYAPLYLANYCMSGCAYCGFASDRVQPRRRLEPPEVEMELASLKEMGFEEVLLLTGERTSQAGFGYLLECVSMAARRFHAVGIEAFPMTTREYALLADAGCSGVTLYQETYDPLQYDRLHRWGPKKDYLDRLDAPARAMEAGMRTVGMGVLLGLSDPVFDAVCLLRHACHLQRIHWKSGIALSFPRLQPQAGNFTAPFPVDEALLARMMFAVRIVLPEVPLLLSTRERPGFRDGMAGLGVCKMSAGSRTTVGGYGGAEPKTEGQFRVGDERSVPDICAMLRHRGLKPVFKNWDSVFRDTEAGRNG
ncbi:MAG: thiamine biosynthesis protein ThiH [Deltaproteobacteria bacterium RIFOXYB2_FULL_66_7]|nr:MAG: thiamine biosynthesis protein ThiH [Deltaproteobacteria bacterium RIFOXYB2_FULL_66_7]